MLKVTSHTDLNQSSHLKFDDQAPALLTALLALKQGKLVPKTLVDSRIVHVETEEMIRKLFSKNYTIRLNDRGFYFLSPPGLLGGAPKLNHNQVVSERNRLISLIQSELNRSSYASTYEHLLCLKTLLSFSRIEQRDQAILDFLKIVTPISHVDFPPKLKCQILHLLKFLALSNLTENGTQTLSEAVSQLASPFLPTNARNSLPDTSDILFYKTRGQYEFEAAHMLLERQFSPPSGQAPKPLKVNATVLKVFAGDAKAMNDCLGTGLDKGIDTWTATNEDQKLKKLVAIEVINHCLRNETDSKLTLPLAKQLFNQFRGLYDSLVQNLGNEKTWVLLYGCLDGLSALANHPIYKDSNGEVLDLLVSRFPLKRSLMYEAEEKKEFRKRVEIKLIEILWQLSHTGRLQGDWKSNLENLVSSHFTIIPWFIQNDFNKTLNKNTALSDYIPTFAIDDATWMSKLEAIYKTVLKDKPHLRENIKDRAATEIGENVVFTEETKRLIGSQLLGDPRVYLRHFCHYLKAIEGGIFIAPLAAVASDYRPGQPGNFKGYVVPPPPVVQKVDDDFDDDWQISSEDKSVPKDNNPFKLPALALGVVNETRKTVLLKESIFCLGAFMEVVRQLPTNEKRDLLILFGRSTVGKSTTANFIAGYPLKKVDPATVNSSQLDDLIVLDSPDPKAFLIGHDHSTTFIPQAHLLHDNTTWLCDLPGLADDRGFQVRIAEAAAMSALVNQAKNVRIFLLIEYKDFQGSMAELLNDTLRDLVARLGSINALYTHLNAVLFGITKFPPTISPNIKQKVEARLIEALKKLSNKFDGVTLSDQIVYVDPLGQRSDLMNALARRTYVPGSPESFQTVLDDSTKAKLTQVIQGWGQRIEGLFKRGRYREVVQEIEQLKFLQNIDVKESKLYFDKITEFVRKEVEDIKRDIEALIPEKSEKRAHLRKKMDAFRKMGELNACTKLDRPLAQIYQDFAERIRKKEEELQNERKALAEGVFMHLRERFHRQLQEQPTEACTFTTYEEARQVPALTVVLDIENLRQEIQTEEANKAAMYCNGNLVPLTPLLMKIARDLDALVFQTYVQTKLVVIEAVFNGNFTFVKQQVDGLVELHFNTLYDQKYTLSTYLEALNRLSVPTERLAEIRIQFTILETIFNQRENLQDNQKKASLEEKRTQLQRQLDQFFTELQTKMRARKVRSLKEQILRPLSSLDQPPPRSWNENCILLKSLDPSTYQEVVKSVRKALIEDPTKTIERETTVPSGNYVQVLGIQFSILAYTKHLRSVIDKEGQQAETRLQEEVSRRERDRIEKELDDFQIQVDALIQRFKAFYEKACLEKQFDVFQGATDIPTLQKKCTGISFQVLTDLERAVASKDRRYTSLRGDNRLTDLQERTKRDLNAAIEAGRNAEAKAKYQNQLNGIIVELDKSFEKFLQTNAHALQLTDITWEGLRAKGFSPQKMNELDTLPLDPSKQTALQGFLARAVNKTQETIAKKQYEILMAACRNNALLQLANQRQIAFGLAVIRTCHPQLYQTALTHLSDYIRNKYTQPEVEKALGSGAFGEVRGFYTTIQAVQNEVGQAITFDLTPLHNAVRGFVTRISQLAEEEIKADPKSDEYFSILNIKTLYELNRAMGGTLLEPLKGIYLQALNLFAQQVGPFLAQSENYQLAIELVAKQIIKYYLMSIPFEKMADCVAIIRKATNPFDKNNVYHLTNNLEKLKTRYPSIENDILALIQQLPEFGDADDPDRFPKTTFEQALSGLKVEPYANVNQPKLRQAYEQFHTTYTALLMTIQQGKFDRNACSQQARTLASHLNGKQLYLNADHVGRLLGYIFAAWTYTHTDSKREYKHLSNYLQPHPAQILAILRLVGVDRSTPLENQINEILTGEGKSICLGATATLFALMGYDVSVLCYNPYLSERDENLFKKLFQFFGIGTRYSFGNQNGKVFYGSIGSIVSNYIEQDCFPNRSSHVNAFLKGSTPYRFSGRDTTKRVLLIDEVDVFFGPNFYSKTTGRITILEAQESKDLVNFIWDNKAQFLNYAYNVNTVMAQPFVTRLYEIYPNLSSGLLRKEVEQMLAGIREFPMNAATTHKGFIHEGKIGYLDEATCTVSVNTYMNDYSTQFAYLYYKEKGQIPSVDGHLGVMIACGQIANSKIPEFFDIRLGLTGTVKDIAGEEKAILKTFGMTQFSYIPSVYQNKQQLIIKDTQIKEGDIYQYYAAIKTSLKDCWNNLRAAIVVFEDAKKLEEFRGWLERYPEGLPVPGILNESVGFSKRQTVIYESTTKQKITLITRQYGRGTDFICRDKHVIANGGVHIIAAFMPESAVEETQIRGRSARQDNPGSYEKILWARDLISKGYIPQQKTHNISAVTDEDLNAQRDLLISRTYQSVQTELETTRASHELTHQLMLAIENGDKEKASELLMQVN